MKHPIPPVSRFSCIAWRSCSKFLPRNLGKYGIRNPHRDVKMRVPYVSRQPGCLCASLFD
jgi:hypothetical protein